MSLSDPAKPIRHLATGLLLGSAILFVATFYLGGFIDGYWLGFVRAFSEAAMVGALADWFAVTALFRHPMGVPLPHTAIIPRQKNRIGRTLGRFVVDNFLAPEVLTRTLERVSPASAISVWLAVESHRNRCVRGVLDASRGIIAALDDHEMRKFFDESVKRMIAQIDLPALLASIVEQISSPPESREFTQQLLEVIEHMLNQHEEFLRETIKKEMPWYVPGFVHDTVYRGLVSRVRRALGEINTDPMHPFHKNVERAIDEFTIALRSSIPLRARIDRLRERMLTSPVLAKYVGSIVTQLLEVAHEKLDPDSPELAKLIEAALAQVGARISQDDGFRLNLDQLLRRAILSLVRDYRDVFGIFIASTVERWDANTVTEKIEMEVGRDLQFIRINGTLVGGLVGVIIHLLSLYFGGT